MIKDYTETNSSLLQKAADGDESAREELITRNMGLVHSVVRRFIGRGHETEDLFQIGCIGLIRAVERFDPSFGVQFSTYAVPMIIGEIKRFIRDDGIIKVSRSLKTIAAQAAQIRDRVTKDTGREPSVSELASELGISPAELAAALDSQQPPQSLYITTDDGSSEGKPLIDRLECDDDPVGEMLSRLLLRQTLSSFGERDRKLIYLRYYRHQTQTQVAEQLGISQVQVSRLEKKILLKMREKIEDA